MTPVIIRSNIASINIDARQIDNNVWHARCNLMSIITLEMITSENYIDVRHFSLMTRVIKKNYIN